MSSLLDVVEKLTTTVDELKKRISELERGESPAGVDPAGHLHAKLVASDGDPNPALSADASGKVSFPAGTGINEFSIDDTMAGDSDDAVPTEQAVKAFVEANTGAYGCAFLYYNYANDANQTGAGARATVDFDTKVFDLGNDFAADTFTAPATGTYQLSAAVRLYDVDADHTTGNIFIITSNREYYGIELHPGNCRSSGNQLILMATALVDMDAADVATIEAVLSGGDAFVGIRGHATLLMTHFSGHRAS